MSVINTTGGIRTFLKAAALAALVGGAGAAHASLPESHSIILQSNFYMRSSGGIWMMIDGLRSSPERRGFVAIDGAPKFGYWEPFQGFLIPHGDQGLWILRSFGGITNHGDAPDLCHGALQDCSGFQPGTAGDITAAAPTPTGNGFYATGFDGKLWAVGDAQSRGDVVKVKGHPSGIAVTPSGRGYYILMDNGIVHCFGDAVCWKVAENKTKNRTAVGIALSLDLTGNANGLWIAYDDGGIVTAGCAPFLGSTGGRGNEKVYSPVEGLTALPEGRSYGWIWDDGHIELSTVQDERFGHQEGDGRNSYDGSCTRGPG